MVLQSLLADMRPYAPFFIRVTLGVVFMAHGADKLFGAFGSGGLPATALSFEKLGLQPAYFQALMAGTLEALGGLCITLGLLTRLGALMIAITMGVAIAVVHGSHGLFAHQGGFEYPMVALGGALSLMFSGGGSMALDRLLFDRLIHAGSCGNRL